MMEFLTFIWEKFGVVTVYFAVTFWGWFKLGTNHIKHMNRRIDKLESDTVKMGKDISFIRGALDVKKNKKSG